jgi:hypothetical protein
MSFCAGRDVERDRFVDIVEMESAEVEDIDRARSCIGGGSDLGLADRERLPSAFPLAASALASCSSATPVLRRRSLVVSLDSGGASLGFSSCCVRDGRETYGLAWTLSLHS